MSSSGAANVEHDKRRAGRSSRRCVLVVDDDRLVCALTSEMLRELGFEVHEAYSAAAALKSLRAGLKVHMLVTDIRMPDMSGVELAELVQAENAAMRVLYVSAYAMETRNAHENRLRGELLTKPFTFAELERAMLRLSRRGH